MFITNAKLNGHTSAVNKNRILHSELKIVMKIKLSVI